MNISYERTWNSRLITGCKSIFKNKASSFLARMYHFTCKWSTDSPLYALTEPVSFRFVRGGVGSFAFYIFIDKSLKLKVRSCDAYRDVVTLLKPLRCLFKLHVFCDLPLKKDIAFKHLRTCIYLKWAPDKSPVILGIFA